MTGKIPVVAAKNVAHQYGLKQCLLIGFDGEFAHVVTYGRTPEDCAAAAKAQDFWTGKIREFSFQGPSGGWQPIETAPKDGTLLDLYIPHVEDRPLTDEGYSVTIGMNNFDNDGDDNWQYVGWNWEQDMFSDIDDPCIGKPTHWRRRPSPPTTAGTDGR
jgi:hypothetical protein